MTDMSAIGGSRGRCGRAGLIDRHDLVATLDRGGREAGNDHLGARRPGTMERSKRTGSMT